MAQKREHDEPHTGDKRSQRRDSKGRFAESDNVRSALAGDQKPEAEHDAKPGEGDRDDRHH